MMTDISLLQPRLLVDVCEKPDTNNFEAMDCKEEKSRRIIFPWLNACNVPGYDASEESPLANPKPKSILRRTKHNDHNSSKSNAVLTSVSTDDQVMGNKSKTISAGISKNSIASDSIGCTRSIKFDPVIRVRELRETSTKEELEILWFTVEELRSFQYLAATKIYRHEQIVGKKIQTKAAFSHPALKVDDCVGTGEKQKHSKLKKTPQQRRMSAPSA